MFERVCVSVVEFEFDPNDPENGFATTGSYRGPYIEVTRGSYTEGHIEGHIEVTRG